MALQTLAFEKEVTPKPNSIKKILHFGYLEGDSSIGTLREPSSKFNYFVTYNAPKVEWLLVSSYGLGKEFKEEDRKG